MAVHEVVRNERFPDRAGDVAGLLSYLALAWMGEERQLGRVSPALAVRRHVTAAARELQGGKAAPKKKPKKHTLRKLVGVAIVAVVVVGALRRKKPAAA